MTERSRSEGHPSGRAIKHHGREIVCYICGQVFGVLAEEPSRLQAFGACRPCAEKAVPA